MKTFLLMLTFVTTTAFAQTWTETYRLPEGTTHRAKAAGYDCGTFPVSGPNTYVAAPKDFSDRKIEWRQLSADKDLNKFLFEAEYPGTNGEKCVYGVFLDRNRDSKTLDFTSSLITTTEGMDEFCADTKNFLDTELLSVAYEGSKRGLRYVAVEVVKTENEVCSSKSVRIVFDRRL